MRHIFDFMSTKAKVLTKRINSTHSLAYIYKKKLDLLGCNFYLRKTNLEKIV